MTTITQVSQESSSAESFKKSWSESNNIFVFGANFGKRLINKLGKLWQNKLKKFLEPTTSEKRNLIWQCCCQGSQMEQKFVIWPI